MHIKLPFEHDLNARSRFAAIPRAPAIARFHHFPAGYIFVINEHGRVPG
jgi:hypothetical protein